MDWLVVHLRISDTKQMATIITTTTNTKCKKKAKFSIMIGLYKEYYSFEFIVYLAFFRPLSHSRYLAFIIPSMHRALNTKKMPDPRNQSDFGFSFDAALHSTECYNSPGQAFASKNIEIITRQANRTESQQAISHEYKLCVCV